MTVNNRNKKIAIGVGILALAGTMFGIGGAAKPSNINLNLPNKEINHDSKYIYNDNEIATGIIETPKPLGTTEEHPEIINFDPIYTFTIETPKLPESKESKETTEIIEVKDDPDSFDIIELQRKYNDLNDQYNEYIELNGLKDKHIKELKDEVARLKIALNKSSAGILYANTIKEHCSTLI